MKAVSKTAYFVVKDVGADRFMCGTDEYHYWSDRDEARRWRSRPAAERVIRRFHRQLNSGQKTLQLIRFSETVTVERTADAVVETFPPQPD